MFGRNIKGGLACVGIVDVVIVDVVIADVVIVDVVILVIVCFAGFDRFAFMFALLECLSYLLKLAFGGMMSG